MENTRKPTTYETLLTDTREFLIPSDVSALIGCNKHTLSVVAAQNPEKLGFPITRLGNRTYIPRRAFIAWLTGTSC